MEEVKITISGGYGAGFSTWNDAINEKDINIAFLVEAEEWEELAKYVEELTGDDFYSAKDLEGNLYVVTVPKGTAYRIEEFDGAESLVTVASLTSIA